MSGCENEILMATDYLRLIYEELAGIHHAFILIAVLLFCLEIVIVATR